MSTTEWHTLSDEELRVLAKKRKGARITSAFAIGFMIGVVIYSVFNETISLVVLFPLFIVFKIFHKPAQDKALREELEKRGLA